MAFSKCAVTLLCSFRRAHLTFARSSTNGISLWNGIIALPFALSMLLSSKRSAWAGCRREKTKQCGTRERGAVSKTPPFTRKLKTHRQRRVCVRRVKGGTRASDSDSERARRLKTRTLFTIASAFRTDSVSPL